MTIEINHRKVEIEENVSLQELLASHGFNGIGQAVAVNGRVVPKARWAIFKVEDGHKITVIGAVCGG